MSKILTRSFLIVFPVLIGLLFTRSPFFMASQAPTGGKPWANSPIKLITTPQYETKKAPHVQPPDKAAFIGYALTWYKFVKSHHDDEEATLFTKVEELLGDKAIWGQTHKEHEAFLGGLGEFQSYLSSLESPEDFSGDKLRGIMSSFQEPFDAHFHSEIGTISRLAEHPNAPKPGTPEEATAALTFKTWGKSTVTKAGTLDVVPFFLLNLDGTVEEGLWANWPPIPAPIKWGLTNIAGAYYSSWWKFSSCAGGKPRELYAL